jgi:hypothetical protein
MSLFGRHGDDMVADMDMAGMNTTASGSSTTEASTMMMMVTFTNELATPLYSMSWTPNSVGTYAATCLFLIALAVLLRGLFALKALQESRWLDQELNRRFIVVNGRLPMHEQMSTTSLKQNMMLSANGTEEQVMVVQKKGMESRPWRASVDPVRAVTDTVIAGVGYLL